MTFDVVIPTYNNLAELKSCLRALASQTFQDFRVLICVDGSTDGTLEHLSSADYGFPFRVLTHPDGKNKGRAQARNLCLFHLKARYLLLVDSDMAPRPDLLEKHFKLLDSCNCVSLGVVRYTNTDENVVADYVMSRGRNRFRNGDALPGRYFNTGNAAFPSDYFIRLKGQDTGVRAYGGDVAFGIRLEQSIQVPIIFNKQAECTALYNKTLDEILGQMREMGAVNLPYLEKKFSGQNLFGLDLMRSKNLKCRVVRLFLKPVVGRMIKRVLPLLPWKWRRLGIHTLFFLNIFLGYRSGSDFRG